MLLENVISINADANNGSIDDDDDDDDGDDDDGGNNDDDDGTMLFNNAKIDRCSCTSNERLLVLSSVGILAFDSITNRGLATITIISNKFLTFSYFLNSLLIL